VERREAKKRRYRREGYQLCGIPHPLGGFEEEEKDRKLSVSVVVFGWFGLL